MCYYSDKHNPEESQLIVYLTNTAMEVYGDEVQDDLAWVDEGDILADGLTVEDSVDDSFNFPNQVCSHCDGYYGPCFGQHACTTCNFFLFPDNINKPPEANFSEASLSIICSLITSLSILM